MSLDSFDLSRDDDVDDYESCMSVTQEIEAQIIDQMFVECVSDPKEEEEDPSSIISPKYEDNPVLPAELISQNFNNSSSTEDYLQLCVWYMENMDTIEISKKASVCELYNRICSLFNLEKDKIRICGNFGHNKVTLLNESHHSLEEAQLFNQDGKLAVAFGDLLSKLWSLVMSEIKPDLFKGVLVRFAPQFIGENQHDSQELLAFLLDGLHEDLNRVKDKPHTEIHDVDGCPDEEVAVGFWQNHKARNDSIIVDIFQGQYKSTLLCAVCSRVSVTFDPFMYLSLPLPSKAKRTMTVTVFHGDGRELPMSYTITVPKHGFVKDLVHALSSECCLKTDETILLAKVSGNESEICQYLEDPSIPISSIMDSDKLAAYSLPLKHKKLKRLVVLHQDERCLINSGQEWKTATSQVDYKPIIRTPLVTCLAEGVETESGLRAAVGAMLSPLLRRELLPSHQVDTVQENNLHSVDDVEGSIEDSDPSSNGNGQMKFNMELEEVYKGTSLPLSSIGNSNSDESHPLSRLDQTIQVFINWSPKELCLYDTKYLECLPSVGVSPSTVTETVSLFSCFEAFLKEEPLGENDMWYCPACKEHRKATKKLDMWRLPDILVVHLKRFSYNQCHQKDDTPVDFPLTNLDLRSYVRHTDDARSHIYDLYATINHHEHSSGGHYTAYSKLLVQDRWYCFNDSLVTPVSEDDVRSSEAYMLFYRRVQHEATAKCSQVQYEAVATVTEDLGEEATTKEDEALQVDPQTS